jgi:hypothetical protein
LPRPLEAATNIDVGRDFFDVAIASGSFGISLASPILSFTFTPEPGIASGSITFNGTTQAIGSGYKDLVAALL